MPLFHTSTVGQIDESSTAATITTIAAEIASSVLLAANPDRKGAIVHNKSTSKLHLALSATATVTAYTAPLDPDDYWEMPFNYTGVISGIWTAANGNAIVTELT